MEMTNEQARWQCLMKDISTFAHYELTVEQFEKLHHMIYAAIAIIVSVSIVIGVIILLNQRKIRKELRQLREMMEATSSGDQTNGQ